MPAPSNVRPFADTAKVVKTGSLQLEVQRGAVAPTMGRLTTLATGVNGYVADTKTSEGGDTPSGSMTLRVPSGRFEDVRPQVRSLGTVHAVTSHGQDVTGQYTDIQARLTALNATRSQLLTILQKATAIGDVLAVQDRINQVQTEIEQLQGQQRVLDDQASYGTLSVDVAQQGAKLGPPAQRSGLAKAWHDAVHGFTSGVEAIIGGSGTALLVLLVLAALGAMAWGAWVFLRRRLVWTRQSRTVTDLRRRSRWCSMALVARRATSAVAGVTGSFNTPARPPSRTRCMRSMASSDTRGPRAHAGHRAPPSMRSKATSGPGSPHDAQPSRMGWKPSRASSLRKKAGTSKGALRAARARRPPTSIW